VPRRAIGAAEPARAPNADDAKAAEVRRAAWGLEEERAADVPTPCRDADAPWHPQSDVELVDMISFLLG
jgi:hypothetical protein